MAYRLLNQSAPDDTEVRQDVISYIDDWFEANPKRLLDAQQVKSGIVTFVGNRASQRHVEASDQVTDVVSSGVYIPDGDSRLIGPPEYNDSKIRQYVISHIDDWYEVSPDKQLDPDQVASQVEAFIDESMSTGDKSQRMSMAANDGGASDDFLTGGAGEESFEDPVPVLFPSHEQEQLSDADEDIELAMSQVPRILPFVVEKTIRPFNRAKKGRDKYKKTNGETFVQRENGSVDFEGISREIAKETGLKAAAVRIRKGVHDDDSEHGEGEVHLHARHWEQIKKIVDENSEQMFEDVGDYVQYVTENWTEIRATNNGRPVMIVRVESKKGSNANHPILILELIESPSAEFYDVKTGGPWKQGGIKNWRLLTTR